MERPGKIQAVPSSRFDVITEEFRQLGNMKFGMTNYEHVHKFFMKMFIYCCTADHQTNGEEFIF
jgi:hypothetical protein